MYRREVLAAGLALGAVAAAGCQGDEPTAEPRTESASETATSTRTPTVPVADEPRIAVTDDAFAPTHLRVTPGTTVTWANEGTISHSVESAVFDPAAATEWTYYSGDLTRGNTASHTFESPGVYEYRCGIHDPAEMCGVVLVGEPHYGGTLPCEA